MNESSQESGGAADNRPPRKKRLASFIPGVRPRQEGRHRISAVTDSTHPPAENTLGFLAEPTTAPRPYRPGRHGRPLRHDEDIQTTAETLSKYKKGYMDAVRELTAKGELPQIMADRVAMIGTMPIWVMPKKHHRFDQVSGGLIVNSLYGDLNVVHETTHPLLFPGFHWAPFDEGVVNKAARLINVNMDRSSDRRIRAGERPTDIYRPNEELVDEIARLTGLDDHGIIAIGTTPADQYDTLEKIKNMSAQTPELVNRQRLINLDEINRRRLITPDLGPGQRGEGIIDYARRLEREEQKRLAAGDKPGYKITSYVMKMRDEAAGSTCC